MVDLKKKNKVKKEVQVVKITKKGEKQWESIRMEKDSLEKTILNI